MKAYARIQNKAPMSWHHIFFISVWLQPALSFFRSVVYWNINLLDEIWHLLMVSKVVQYKEPGVYEEIKKNRPLY